MSVSEQSVIEEVVERLSHRYPAVSIETVATVVTDQYARFDGRPVRDFVPLFVEKGARAQLAHLHAADN